MRSSRRTWLSLAGAFAFTLAPLAATGQAPGELRVALTQEPGTLDPIVGTLAVENDVVDLLFDGLTRYDERGRQIPDLATVVPTRANGGISADGRTITYHLVRNARWQDGVPVTSRDVAFTFAALMNPKNSVANTDPYDQIARVETPDPYTARIVLRRPYAPAIDAFSDRNDGAIVPEHLLASLPDLNHADFNAAPIGSGPYKLVAWHHGSDMVFEANPDYFRGPPKIARIHMQFINNDNTMLIALRTGELDLADRLSISTFSSVGAAPGMVPATVAQSFWEHLTFNTARAPLDDRRVRLALCYGFDVRDITAKIAHGLGALGAGSQNPLLVWHDARLQPFPLDPRRAAALLDDAGWKIGSDGIRVKDGNRLTLTLEYPAGNITRDQTAVTLQQSWRAIGVDTVVKTFPAATFFAPAAMGGPFYGGNYDVGMSAFIFDVPDPSRVNENSAAHIPPHGNNLSRYANAELTSLEDAAAEATDDAERKRLEDRIQAIEVREVPYVTMRWQALLDMRSTRLLGLKPPPVGSTFWNAASWTLDEGTAPAGR